MHKVPTSINCIHFEIALLSAALKFCLRLVAMKFVDDDDDDDDAMVTISLGV